MTEVKKIRLIRVAKEFNVGINTLTGHLLKKGILTEIIMSIPVGYFYRSHSVRFDKACLDDDLCADIYQICVIPVVYLLCVLSTINP